MLSRSWLPSQVVCRLQRTSENVLRRKRTDWRFLMPDAQQARFGQLLLLGGSEMLGKALVDAGTADQVTYCISSDRSVDAAAVLDGAGVPLGQVANCLKEGAPLYLEANRLPLSVVWRGMRGIQSWMNAHSLTLTGIYWVLPGFREAKKFIPLNLPDAIEWYLDSSFVAGTPVHRVLEMGLRLWARHHSERVIPFARSLALTAIKNTHSHAEPAVIRMVPEIRGKDVRMILLTSGQDESSRIVILPVVPRHANPTAVVKIATHPKFNEMTRVEQERLVMLRQTLTSPLRDSVPEPRALELSAGHIVAVQSYIRGQSLWVSSGRWHLTSGRAEQDLEMAANWLLRFHRELQVETIRWDDEAIAGWLEPRLQEYAQLWTLSPGEKELWARTRTRARALLSKSLPGVWQHNDFGLWNLYRNGNDLSVIDWESSRPGLPLCDLIYLVTHWTFIVRRYHSPAAERRGIAELFVTRAPTPRHSRVAQRVIDAYLKELNIDPGFLPVLLVYTWVDRAIDRVHRQRRLGNSESANRADNRFVSYIGVLAAGADQVFC